MEERERARDRTRAIMLARIRREISANVVRLQRLFEFFAQMGLEILYGYACVRVFFTERDSLSLVSEFRIVPLIMRAFVPSIMAFVVSFHRIAIQCFLFALYPLWMPISIYQAL